MLSLPEIGDRILLAVTDTMGASRAMVLLLDADREMYVAAAIQGDSDVATRYEIPASHPVWVHLLRRREELARSDFDDDPDDDAQGKCRAIYDALDVELIVPMIFRAELLGVFAVGR